MKGLQIAGLCIGLCLGSDGYAQQLQERKAENLPADSVTRSRRRPLSPVQQAAGAAITSRFPATRLVDVQYNYLTPADYRWKLYKQPYEKGKLDTQNRVMVALNIPFYWKHNWVLSSSLRYNYAAINFGDVEMQSAAYPQSYHGGAFHSHLWQAAFNVTYFSELWGKTAIYNATLHTQGSNKGLEQVDAFLLAGMILKSTKRTTLTVGVAGFIGPTVRIPVVPVFTMDHQFTPTVSFSTVLPQFLYFRKTFGTTSRLSLGSEFEVTNYYVYPEEVDKTYLFQKSELKSGIMYEYYLFKHIILTCKTGLVYTFGTDLQPANRSSKHKILTGRKDLNGYFNVGFSYSLF
ncbi:MAG: DUF6268 family outer membrane beta-barrel protein [Bacteroides sp.]|nr:DUF6268 family outer membrane beta-barrel protein [Bacteroides sp.]